LGGLQNAALKIFCPKLVGGILVVREMPHASITGPSSASEEQTRANAKVVLERVPSNPLLPPSSYVRMRLFCRLSKVENTRALENNVHDSNSGFIISLLTDL
jgi:hypothetical protein